MVGNDIVDVSEAKRASNWQRPRFLEKIFTSKEQCLIQNSKDPFTLVWRLWSIKEAAYKLYTQIYPSRFYNPKGFECELKNSHSKVVFKNFKCYVQTKTTSEYIISEARLGDCEMTSKILLLKDKNSESQSEFLKVKLLDRISEDYNLALSNLNFNKSEFGIPTVNFNSETLNVSLTHHGNYGAIAIS